MASIEEDERREAAIASTPSLQPNFKPVGVTNRQLSKFQELHKRRLQIKAGSKSQKKSKDGPGKSYGNGSKYLKLKDCTEENASITMKESSVSISKGNNVKDKPSLQQGDIATHLASKKCQKLHWGYCSPLDFDNLCGDAHTQPNKSLWVYSVILKLVVLHSICPFYVTLNSFLLGYAILFIGSTQRKGGKGKLTCRFATWMEMSLPGCAFSNTLKMVF